jgi:hypothetical protein
MFAVIYRWRLHPGLEQDFIANWRQITEFGITGGSSLFKDADGCWVAIARWSSRDARDRVFAELTSEVLDPVVRERASQAVIERFPDQELESVLDLWTNMDAPAS